MISKAIGWFDTWPKFAIFQALYILGYLTVIKKYATVLEPPYVIFACIASSMICSQIVHRDDPEDDDEESEEDEEEEPAGESVAHR